MLGFGPLLDINDLNDIMEDVITNYCSLIGCNLTLSACDPSSSIIIEPLVTTWISRLSHQFQSLTISSYLMKLPLIVQLLSTTVFDHLVELNLDENHKPGSNRRRSTSAVDDTQLDKINVSAF